MYQRLEFATVSETAVASYQYRATQSVARKAVTCKTGTQQTSATARTVVAHTIPAAELEGEKYDSVGFLDVSGSMGSGAVAEGRAVIASRQLAMTFSFDTALRDFDTCTAGGTDAWPCMAWAMRHLKPGGKIVWATDMLWILTPQQQKVWGFFVRRNGIRQEYVS